MIAHDPYVDDARFAAVGVERVTLEALAERADYVSVHTLLNAETHHLIGEAFFRRMKPTAILVNTTRRPVVDEAALAKALAEKRPAAPRWTCWEREPVEVDNPLLRMDNVLATPHAAYFSSPAVAQVPRRCGEEVARALRGQRPVQRGEPGGLRARGGAPRPLSQRVPAGRRGRRSHAPDLNDGFFVFGSVVVHLVRIMDHVTARRGRHGAAGSKFSPVPIHQVPEITTKKRSCGWKCGRLMLPGSHLRRTT